MSQDSSFDVRVHTAEVDLIGRFVKERDLAPPAVGYRYGSIHGLMLAEALLWQRGTFPAGLQRGPDQDSFANAARFADQVPGLTYVEGFAVTCDDLTVHHAWCVTDEGIVVDPTWPDGCGLVYWGVPLTESYRADVLRRRGGSLAALLDPEIDDALLIVGLPPGARDTSGPGAPRYP